MPPNWNTICQAFANTRPRVEDNINEDLIHGAIFANNGTAPYENILDFFQLYSSNLLNSGLPGPNATRFGMMTRHAIDANNQLFLVNENLVNFNLSYFCQASRVYANQNPLVDNGNNQNYLMMLDHWSNMNHDQIIQDFNNPPYNNTVLKRLLESINQMAWVIIDQYQGSASIFSQGFADQVQGEEMEAKLTNANIFYQHRYLELNDVGLLGPATLANFFKDLNIGRIFNQNWLNFNDSFASYAVKPDIHVMRLMLVITGRITIDSYQELLDLARENIIQLNQLYAILQPNDDYLTPNDDLAPSEICINDVRRWALVINRMPVEIDRILYMVGSGRPPNINLINEKNFRYHIFLNSLGLQNYHPN